MTVKVFNVDGTATKRCPHCALLKPLTKFARDSSKSDGVTSWCKECRARKRRQNRATGAKEKSYIQDPVKVKAKEIIRFAIDNGLIARPDKCDMCHRECTPEGHHPNYNKPYLVYWLCKDCHAFVHSRTEDEIIDRIADYL